jgi:hypothetical protein
MRDALCCYTLCCCVVEVKYLISVNFSHDTLLIRILKSLLLGANRHEQAACVSESYDVSVIAAMAT